MISPLGQIPALYFWYLYIRTGHEKKVSNHPGSSKDLTCTRLRFVGSSRMGNRIPRKGA